MPDNLFQLGDFALSSGAKSPWKIDCDNLSDGDVAVLSMLVCILVGPFSSVEGIPAGGLRLAKALEPFRQLSGPHLIVDDVLTSGKSMERAAAAFHAWHGGYGVGRSIVGAVIFARGQCPHWIKAVFQMPEAFWIKPTTRGS